MKDYLNAIVRISSSINELSIIKVVFIFLLLTLALFKDEVAHIINSKVFNKDEVVSILDNSIAIDNSLRELLNESNSDRAYIFRFHNGVKYYDGTHKNKFSCDYEVVAKGTSREAMNLQDVPVTLFGNFIKSVTDSNMFYSNINNIDDIAIRSTLSEQGIKAIAVAPYYRDDKLIAMVGIDYVKDVGNLSNWRKDSLLMKRNFFKKVKYIGNLLE